MALSIASSMKSLMLTLGLTILIMSMIGAYLAQFVADSGFENVRGGIGVMHTSPACSSLRRY